VKLKQTLKPQGPATAIVLKPETRTKRIEAMLEALR